MVNYTILAGGYATFLVSYLFNPGGSLTIQGKPGTGENPSWIALHPTNKSILYATNEIEKGALQSFKIGANGALSVVNTVSSGGNGPAFAAPISSGNVPVMNFGSGNGRVIPTSPADASIFNDSAPVITFPVPPNGQSRPHGAYEFGSEIFVPDLGADKIYRLSDAGSPGNWKIAGSIDQPAGSGPRHLVIKDNKVFTLHELSNTLSVQTIPPSPSGVARLLASTSIVPTDDKVPKGAKFAAAEVLYPPPLACNASTPQLFIYASNRNIGEPDPRGDSIAIVQHTPGDVGQKRWHKRANDQLTLANQVFTGLQQIRGMSFSDDGKYLVAGGALSGGVKVYERTDCGRNLVEVARNLDVATRTTFVWV